MRAPLPLVALWLSQTLSLVGSDLTRFGVGVWAYNNSQGSVTNFAWVTVMAETPALLLAPFTGLLIDRVGSKRWLLFLADVVALSASLWLWWHYREGTLTIAHVWVANSVQSVANSIQWPAFMATMTRLVNDDDLIHFGAVNEAIPALVMLVAPSVSAAVLSSTNGDLTPLFVIELATCVVGSLSLLGVKLPTAGAPSGGGASGPQTVMDDLLEPARFILARPPLLLLLAFMATCNLANGMIRILFTPLIMAFSNTSALATVLTLSGTGAIAGSIALSQFSPTKPVRTIMLCSAAQGVLLAAVGAQPSTLLILAVAFLYMSLIPAVRVCRQCIFQHATPAKLHGRIFAMFRAVREGCVPLAGLAAGPLADRLESLMEHANASQLAAMCGPWIGVGKGRGVAVLFVVIGSVYTLISLAGLTSAGLAQLDDNAPKHSVTPPQHEPPKAAGTKSKVQ